MPPARVGLSVRSDRHDRHAHVVGTAFVSGLVPSLPLKSVRGVADVASVGGYVRQYQVNVDPNRLRAYGLRSAACRCLKSGYNGRRRTECSTRRASTWCAVSATRRSPRISRPSELGATGEGDTGPHQGCRGRRSDRSWRAACGSGRRGKTFRGIVVMRQGENAWDVIDRVKTKLRDVEAGLTGRA
jgi:Cu(I)/Ag(I) efflux system membrane protein CusA/SilA